MRLEGSQVFPTPLLPMYKVEIKARILEAPDKDIARERLSRALQEREALRISRQVAREHLAVVTRPQSWPVTITREEAIEDARRLVGSFEVLEDGPIVTESLLSLCHEVSVGGRQIHDANIVATMLARGEHRLLTFSTSDFRRFEERIELMGLQGVESAWTTGGRSYHSSPHCNWCLRFHTLLDLYFVSC